MIIQITAGEAEQKGVLHQLIELEGLDHYAIAERGMNDSFMFCLTPEQAQEAGLIILP